MLVEEALKEIPNTTDPIQVELAITEAINDPHRDGMWDVEDRKITVHVLVRQAAFTLDSEIEPELNLREPVVAALYGILKDSVEDPRNHPGIALAAEHARHLLANTPDIELDDSARAP